MIKNSEVMLSEIKNAMVDLVMEIEALASIDYPKMLQMQVLD
jgi:hypothetical protein